VARLATEYRLPPENLVSPDAVRRLAWAPPANLDPSTVADALAGTGVRRWQIDLLAEDLASALADPPTPAAPPA
jgi:ribonuclease D